ncbi:MAG: MazG-like family protein [Pseudomonadota bacterium]
MELTFETLRQANVARLPTFKNSKGEPAHSEPDGSDWSPAQWFQATLGELGEYANVRKKFDRGDLSHEEFMKQAGGELADTLTYLDILAFRCGQTIGDGKIGGRGTAGLNIEISPATRACRITIALGLVAKQIDRSGAVGRTAPFQNAQGQISDLACQLGIDLGAATRHKFNEVSDRVGSPVWISYDGRVGFRRGCGVDPERCMGNGFGPCPLCYE